MSREELIKRLKEQCWLVPEDTGIELMNVLQDRGLVSDEAVTIDDVAIVDLVTAYETISHGSLL